MPDPEEIEILIPRRLRLLAAEVLRESPPDLKFTWASEDRVKIARSQLHAVQEMFGSTLVESGLKTDDEPSARGLLLEELIDLFSPYY